MNPVDTVSVETVKRPSALRHKMIPEFRFAYSSNPNLP